MMEMEVMHSGQQVNRVFLSRKDQTNYLTLTVNFLFNAGY